MISQQEEDGNIFRKQHKKEEKRLWDNNRRGKNMKREIKSKRVNSLGFPPRGEKQ